MTTMYRLGLYAIILLALASVSFVSGFKVESWHQASLAATAKNQEALDTAAAQRRQDSQTAAVISHFDQLNKDTQDEQALIFNQLQEQGHAFGIIQTKLSSIPVGACVFTPAVDGLLGSAYEIATGQGPASTNSPTKGNKANH